MRIALCLLMMLVMLLSPQQAGDAARDALSTWALGVVPSLFPYMVLCRMLAARQTALPDGNRCGAWPRRRFALRRRAAGWLCGARAS